MALAPLKPEIALAIDRLEATRQRLLRERASLTEKLETVDGTLRQLDERLQRYRRELDRVLGI